VAKKVVDKKVGVVLASLESHSSTWLFQTNGVCEPKYAYPAKKGEGKKMTKKKLLLVSLFLVFGLVTMAATSFAQTQWTVGANENDGGRHQGLTEATGQVTLATISSGSIGASTYFRIDYDAPIVNLATVYIVCAGSASPLSPFNAGTGTYGGVGCGGLFTTALSNSNMTLTISFNDTVVFPTGASSQISITVRVNATGVTCGPEGSNGVHAVVDAHTPTGAPNLTITPFQPSSSLRVLIVHCDPSLSLTLGTEKGKLETEPAWVLTCIGVKDEGPFDNDFTVNVDEVFPYALTSESYELALDPGTGDDGVVTNGTSVDITFKNVPINLTMIETDIKPCSTLWTGNPFYCAGGSLNITEDSGQPVCVADPIVAGTPPTQTCDFAFETTMVDANMPESVDIKFKFWSKGPIPPGSACITANVSKDPTTPATAIPLFLVDPELTTPLSVVCFADCKTVLLYPYVVDDFGYATGITVSNTTADPFVGDPVYGKGSAVPQSGPCTFYLYGTPPGAVYPSAPLTAAFTSPTIGSGQTYAFDMYNNLLPNVAGYIIGVCDFQNAHGLAWLTYHFGADIGVAGTYLADVLPNPALYHRTPAGDILGETAIAPYEIDRHLEKLLNFGLKGIF
jgi:hypothetical protein